MKIVRYFTYTLMYGDGSGRPNSVCGLRFHLSHHDTESMLLKKLSNVVKETLVKKVKNIISTFKINMPLPIGVGKKVVWGGRPNSVCGEDCLLFPVETVTI